MATYPTPPKPSAGGGGGTTSKPRSTSSGGGGGSTRRAPSKSSSGGGGSKDPYAQARADQKAQEKKAATRLSSQAAKLKAQADALRIALGSKGFQAELNRQLG